MTPSVRSALESIVREIADLRMENTRLKEMLVTRDAALETHGTAGAFERLYAYGIACAQRGWRGRRYVMIPAADWRALAPPASVPGLAELRFQLPTGDAVVVPGAPDGCLFDIARPIQIPESRVFQMPIRNPNVDMTFRVLSWRIEPGQSTQVEIDAYNGNYEP